MATATNWAVRWKQQQQQQRAEDSDAVGLSCCRDVPATCRCPLSTSNHNNKLFVNAVMIIITFLTTQCYHCRSESVETLVHETVAAMHDRNKFTQVYKLALSLNRI